MTFALCPFLSCDPLPPFLLSFSFAPLFVPHPFPYSVLGPLCPHSSGSSGPDPLLEALEEDASASAPPGSWLPALDAALRSLELLEAENRRTRERSENRARALRETIEALRSQLEDARKDVQNALESLCEAQTEMLRARAEASAAQRDAASAMRFCQALSETARRIGVWDALRDAGAFDSGFQAGAERGDASGVASLVGGTGRGFGRESVAEDFERNSVAGGLDAFLDPLAGTRTRDGHVVQPSSQACTEERRISAVAQAFTPRPLSSPPLASSASDLLACPSPPFPTPAPADGATLDSYIAPCAVCPAAPGIDSSQYRHPVVSATPWAPFLLAPASEADDCRSSELAFRGDSSVSPGTSNSVSPAFALSPAAQLSLPSLPVSMPPVWSLEPLCVATVVEASRSAGALPLSSRRRSRSLPHLPSRGEASHELSFALARCAGGAAENDSDAEDARRVEMLEACQPSEETNEIGATESFAWRRDTPHPSRDVLLRGRVTHVGVPVERRMQVEDVAPEEESVESRPGHWASGTPSALASPFSVVDRGTRRKAVDSRSPFLSAAPSPPSSRSPDVSPKAKRIVIIRETGPATSPRSRSPSSSSSSLPVPRSPNPEERSQRHTSTASLFHSREDRFESTASADPSDAESAESAPLDAEKTPLHSTKSPAAVVAALASSKGVPKGEPMSQVFVDGIPLVTYPSAALTFSGPLAI